MSLIYTSSSYLLYFNQALLLSGQSSWHTSSSRSLTRLCSVFPLIGCGPARVGSTKWAWSMWRGTGQCIWWAGSRHLWPASSSSQERRDSPQRMTMTWARPPALCWGSSLSGEFPQAVDDDNDNGDEGLWWCRRCLMIVV